MRKIFHGYIARGFWAPFGFGLGVFCLMLLFGSLVDKLSFFMKGGSDAGTLARYIAFQAPYFAVKMAPIATLLAVLFALGGMMGSGEWKAGLAGGWRPFDMIKPLLLCSALAAGGQLLLQETAAPGFFMRAEYLLEGQVRAKRDWQHLVKRDVTFSAGDDVLVTAHVFDGHRRAMERVIVSVYREGLLSLEINAASAAWQPELRRWAFSDGVMIHYGGPAGPSMRRFKTYQSAISVEPENLVLEKLVPDGLSSGDVLRRLRRLRAVGAPASEERTLLWVKLAAPLANPAMALIGAAIVLLLPRGNRFFSFGLALAVGFLFWAAIIMAQAAGNAELVPPAAAGLAPSLLFALASLWGLRRARAI
jgi:lipopolysaccharide export LptBFGC system permease protein LptF